MFMFGLFFILYFVKLSVGIGLKRLVLQETLKGHSATDLAQILDSKMCNLKSI